MGDPQTPTALSVSAALELEIFDRGGARVVAGQRHLGRIIRWVHSAEIPDISVFLAGGELLLTAGLGMGVTEAEQRAYVRAVAGAQIAALAIELSGRVFSELPAAVVEEAANLGLPLIAFACEVPFVEVAAQVHSRIVDLRVEELMQEEAATTAFNELLVRGEDYLAVTDELARRVGFSCIMEDRAHQMRGYCWRTEAADAIVSNWSQHSRLAHDQDGPAGCWREPILLRGEVGGWIHVLHGDRCLSAADSYTIGRAATAIAITLLGEQVQGARRAQRDGALIGRLMMGDIGGQGFIDRALKLGRDVRGRSFLVAVVGAMDGGEPFGGPEISESVGAIDAVVIVADTCDITVAVIALPPKKDEGRVIDALSQASARVGVSRMVESQHLLAAVQQAHRAYAATGKNSHHFVRFDDLGALRLLLALAEGPELASYVEDELGRLMDHDARTVNQLLPTLRVFLDCDGRKAQAAQQLYIQRRTLYYRIDRINSLLGLSLNDPAIRHRLLLAVRGLDLLQHRSHGHRSSAVLMSGDR